MIDTHSRPITYAWILTGNDYRFSSFSQKVDSLSEDIRDFFFVHNRTEWFIKHYNFPILYHTHRKNVISKNRSIQLYVFLPHEPIAKNCPRKTYPLQLFLAELKRFDRIIVLVSGKTDLVRQSRYWYCLVVTNAVEIRSKCNVIANRTSTHIRFSGKKRKFSSPKTLSGFNWHMS